MPFCQDPPQTPDLYQADPALATELGRHLPDALHRQVQPRFEAMGRATAGTLLALAEAAEANPPVHVPFDPWGNRIDQIRVHPAWDALKDFAAEHRLVATGYDESLGDRRRVVQAGLLHLYSASSATFSCPLAMTDAAARVLLDVAPNRLRERLLPRLLSADPARFITSGQWMTEQSGGSDVGYTEATAHRLGEVDGEDRFSLTGPKWFASATTAEMALTLARVSDPFASHADETSSTRDLTMFCVEVARDDAGGLRDIQIERLKDKLGTRALPTAELTLNGLVGTRLGEVGRGVAEIATMLTITRFHNAIAAASGMARAVALARDYAERRVAFDRKLADLPLHAWTLDQIGAESAAATSLVFEVASLLGKAEAGTASEDERRRLRALIPLAKLTTGKQAITVASEALECFGGAGYVEDTGLPRLLRDAQVLSIWEGTTNVLSLDLLRAQKKEAALTAVLDDYGQRAGALAESLDRHSVSTITRLFGRLGAALMNLATSGQRGALEAHARRIALGTGYAVQATLLGETALQAGPDAMLRFEDFVALRLEGPLG